MQIKEKRDTFLFTIVACSLSLALIASVWMLATREFANRRLLLDFTVYRQLTELTDLARLGDIQIDAFADVLGFGLYGMDGRALIRKGTAPEFRPPPSASRRMIEYVVHRDTIVLERMVGAEGPGRRMMGGPMFGVQPLGRGRPEGLPESNPVPGLAWLEYSLGSFHKSRGILIAASSIISLVLASVAILLISLYRKMSRYRDRALQDRELVELGNSARTIAHEIKNPLGVIRIQCGILRRSLPATAESVSVIENEIMRLSMLTDRIRDYLKGEGDENGSIPIAAFIDSFKRRYMDACDFSVSASLGGSLLGNEERLRGAIDNIINNALDAHGARSPGSYPDERVRVEFKEDSTARSRQLLVSISDRGDGVPADLKGRLFQPFFTTKAQGSGLGLALSKKAVEGSGGTIGHADRAGGGSVFFVRLPVIIN